MLIAFALLGCTSGEPTDVAEVPPPPPVAPAPRHVTLFGVLPDTMHDIETPPSRALIDLGRMLYFDARLSKDQQYSCNSCHELAEYGAAREPTSGGAPEGQRPRNAPSTFNATLQFRQYWDGRSDDLVTQAQEAFLNPREMAMASQSDVVSAVSAIPGYADAFAAAFPAEPTVTFGSISRALVAFQQGLVTSGSKLDRYLMGEGAAMTPEEVAGFDRFVSTGCVSCHSGVLLGGGMFQRLGAVHAWDTPDEGRAWSTGDEAERRLFKVPSLRNVAETGPWLHDGSATTLPDVVRRMAHHQLGRDLSDDDVSSIVLFLSTLTGTLPTDYIAEPPLP
ncbi:MAG: cytochrome-c peroxidase [Myxococcales bacterium]|nr:cytochrome-c peroxidase [Myxococcales bacterium]